MVIFDVQIILKNDLKTKFFKNVFQKSTIANVKIGHILKKKKFFFSKEEGMPQLIC